MLLDDGAALFELTKDGLPLGDGVACSLGGDLGDAQKQSKQVALVPGQDLPLVVPGVDSPLPQLGRESPNLRLVDRAMAAENLLRRGHSVPRDET